MTKYIDSLSLHVENFLFERFAFPKVRKMDISKAALKPFLPKEPVIIDCGAHDGTDSINLLKILHGKIHSFEPVDEIYLRLEKNTLHFDEITCHKIALSDKDGFSEFYVSEGASDGSSSLLAPKQHLIDHPHVTFNKKILVRTQTLDNWAARNGIDHVDLLWLDMQGFEMNMLQASEKIFPTARLIHTEVSTRETYLGVPQYPEYRAFLESKGFCVLYEAIPCGWDMGNVLFVNQELL